MKTTFELRTWLTENRETIISKFNSLTTEQFYNGITLKEFMVEIMSAMSRNNVKSANRAASLLPTLMGQIYFENSKLSR